LPSVTLGQNGDSSGGGKPATATATDAPMGPTTFIPSRPGRSQEWRNLPRQSWENITVSLPPEIDPLGFDRNAKIAFKVRGRIMAHSVTGEIQHLGKIKTSHSQANYMGLADIVYIETSENLEIGKTYGLTGEPISVSSSDRSTDAHGIVGIVEVTNQ